MKNILLAFALMMSAASILLGTAHTAAANENTSASYTEWGSSDSTSAPLYWGGETFADLEELIERLRVFLEEFRARQDDAYPGTSAAQVNVTTEAATDVDEESARLNGELELNSEDAAEVWFEYGMSRDGMTERTEIRTFDTDDEDDGMISFFATVSDLNEDTEYYFRAVAEDEEGGRDTGERLTFRTSEEDADEDTEDDDLDEMPDIRTGSTESVTNRSAVLEGSVEMNDLSDGTVFFVYSEEEELVQDVAEDYSTFEEVEENDSSLWSGLVDSGVSDDSNFSLEVEDLEDDTTYYYAAVIAYEDEDGEEVMRTGAVRSFTTDDSE